MVEDRLGEGERAAASPEAAAPRSAPEEGWREGIEIIESAGLGVSASSPCVPPESGPEELCGGVVGATSLRDDRRGSDMLLPEISARRGRCEDDP